MNRGYINRIKDKAFGLVGLIATLFGLLILTFLIGQVFYEGYNRIDLDFIKSLPSRKPEKAGIYTALAGTVWILFLTTIFSLPLGISTGIYLEEYTKKSRFTDLLEINVSNLAGVPSIIYGLLGLEVFGRMLNLGNSLLAGALTLSLLVLPIIIVTTREAIRAVPNSLRMASYGLGASKWQTIWEQILPASMGGILTGVILAISRAVGETAPLLVVGALAYVPFAPSSPLDEFTVLPIQIFNWISRPQHGFSVNAAAAILLLLTITFIMTGVAVYLRNRWQKKHNW